MASTSNKVINCENDAALGNGGLGRLAACFLDSLATHGYPGYGYGIRYEFGLFNQRIEDGQQIEQPENWLRYGNPWEFERPNVIYPVRFGGRILCFKGADGRQQCHWVDTDDVIAMAYDMPISGYDSKAVANLRLWSARSTREFDLRDFNEGNYVEAVREKTLSENLSKVLYPNDATQQGQELRLKQEYFFVSSSLQDILSRFSKYHGDLALMPRMMAIQLNDTHPALAVPEMMRLLVDEKGFDWDKAWDITSHTFAYTNHTLLPEALETWPIHQMEQVLPRHMEIISRINDDFLKRVRFSFPGDLNVTDKTAIVDSEGAPRADGPSGDHRQPQGQWCRRAPFPLPANPDLPRIRQGVPGKDHQRDQRNYPAPLAAPGQPGAVELVTERIGDKWLTDLTALRDLVPAADDPEFRERFDAIKVTNKTRLAGFIKNATEIEADPQSLFDSQVKRMHEYKRQLLNLLHVIDRYVRICDRQTEGMVPRTVVFAGKAAPAYHMAKMIIRLINDVAAVINNDPVVNGLLKVVFVPNYNVTAAEAIIPGSDLSEQISTAGTEASGTGNMKFALNGALTIGTLDGANIEILEEVGDPNIFIFGLTAEEVVARRQEGYDPWAEYNGSARLKRALDMIGEGFFSPDEPYRYRAISTTACCTVVTVTCCWPISPPIWSARTGSTRFTATAKPGCGRRSSMSPTWASSPATAPFIPTRGTCGA